jgi:hypothetical protein
VSGAPPRLKSALWVQALLRAREVSGNFGAVLHKGAEEAGAIFVVINHLDGTYDLLEPPPGPSVDEAGQRLFYKGSAMPAEWPTIRERLDRKRESDPDIWVVEVEDREGLAGLKLSSL